MPVAQEVFEFGRLARPGDGWWAALLAAGVVAFAAWQIGHAGPGLSRGLRAALLALRLAALGLLFWALLDPRRRTETAVSRTPAVGVALDASRSMARRETGPAGPTRLETVRAVVTSLVQSEKYGTPLGTALRVLAQENRDSRMAEAERKAAALPPKLTVPMILFFLPVIFVVILGPSIILVTQAK